MISMNYSDINIILKRDLPIKAYLAQLDIGVQKPAGLYQPIAELAINNSNIINEQLLMDEFEFTMPMATQAIKRSITMGTFEEIKDDSENYHLTTLGEQVAPQKGQIFQRKRENIEFS